MSEKQPQSGEWWGADDGSIAYIVGVKRNGDVILEDERGCHYNGGQDWNEWRHIPDCTGFDWVAPVETWPKYYVHKIAFFCDTAYLRRDSQSECVLVTEQGLEAPYYWTGLQDVFVAEGTWIEVTEAEALSRVKAPPSSVESPDDWVTQDRVPFRMGKDECRWSTWPESWGWWSYPPFMDECMHGIKEGDDAVLHVRCRRRDLPPDDHVSPLPQKHRVRMWVRLDGSVYIRAESAAAAAAEAMPGGCGCDWTAVFASTWAMQ